VGVVVAVGFVIVGFVIVGFVAVAVMGELGRGWRVFRL
jgi:hypothetical protein